MLQCLEVIGLGSRNELGKWSDLVVNRFDRLEFGPYFIRKGGLEGTKEIFLGDFFRSSLELGEGLLKEGLFTRGKGLYRGVNEYFLGEVLNGFFLVGGDVEKYLREGTRGASFPSRVGRVIIIGVRLGRSGGSRRVFRVVRNL